MDIRFFVVAFLSSTEGGSIKWEEKPAAAILNPGEAWSCTLSTSFVR